VTRNGKEVEGNLLTDVKDFLSCLMLLAVSWLKSETYVESLALSKIRKILFGIFNRKQSGDLSLCRSMILILKRKLHVVDVAA